MQAVSSKVIQAPVISPVDASRSARMIEVNVAVERINCRNMVIGSTSFAMLRCSVNGLNKSR